MPTRSAASRKRLVSGTRRALVGDVERAADRVVLGSAALVVLGLEEVGPDVLPAPARRALGLPQVIVQRPAADVEHGVHRARPAQRLAARDVERAAVAVRLGLGREVPVQLGVELLGEARRDLDVGAAVLAAGLDEQDPDAGSSVRRLASTQPAEPAPTTT